MATFRMSQCQGGVKVLNVMNDDIRALNDAFKYLNTRKCTSGWIIKGVLSKMSEKL